MGCLQRLALHLGDGFGDHLAVQVVADGGDVSRLRFAEEVAGAADLEVAHRDLETRAQFGRFADRAQAFVCLLGEHHVAGMEEVGVRPLAACVRRDHATGGADPRPSRSDRSTTSVFTVGMSIPDSMIVVQTSTSYSPCQKSTTTCSSVPSSSCPWATAIRASGTSRRSWAGDVLDRADAVVDPEHLAFAEQLAADRLDGDPLVVLADVGEDRLAVGGRGLQQARDRGCRRDSSPACAGSASPSG